MEDILSQGGDREPSRWPRRLGVIGAAVLVLVLGLVYLSRTGHSRSPAAAASTPARAGAARPGAGSQPACFPPPPGVPTRMGGRPADGAGYKFFGAEGGGVVRAGS